MRNGVLAYACWWTNPLASPDDLTEADVGVNSEDYHWTLSVSGCTDVYHMQSVMAHEVGHIFGMAHVTYSDHPWRG